MFDARGLFSVNAIMLPHAKDTQGHEIKILVTGMTPVGHYTLHCTLLRTLIPNHMTTVGVVMESLGQQQAGAAGAAAHRASPLFTELQRCQMPAGIRRALHGAWCRQHLGCCLVRICS